MNIAFYCFHVRYTVSPQRQGLCPLLCASHLFSSTWFWSLLLFWSLFCYFDNFLIFRVFSNYCIAAILIVNTCQGHTWCQILNQVFTCIPFLILTAILESGHNYQSHFIEEETGAPIGWISRRWVLTQLQRTPNLHSPFPRVTVEQLDYRGEMEGKDYFFYISFIK